MGLRDTRGRGVTAGVAGHRKGPHPASPASPATPEQSGHRVPSPEILLADRPWEHIRHRISVSTPVKWAQHQDGLSRPDPRAVGTWPAGSHGPTLRHTPGSTENPAKRPAGLGLERRSGRGHGAPEGLVRGLGRAWPGRVKGVSLVELRSPHTSPAGGMGFVFWPLFESQKTFK